MNSLLCTVLDDRYFIEHRIAAGGFGTVYRARSLETGEAVAIKVLHAEHSADPSVSARFRREALTMSSLANPHTVTTYELGEARDGTRFIVMELLEGENLAERFAACGTLHWRTVITMLRAVCESLAEAHRLGIVHRDLKPANMFLCRAPAPDFVKVLDFGIAKILDDSNMHDGTDLTRTGQAIGTLEYMSPEQLVGAPLDRRTDIYTLGVVAYEMITGRRPFADATGATGLVTALVTRRPLPPSTVTTGALPPSLDGVLLRCLEREPEDRYQSVEELAAAFDRMLATKLDLYATQRQWVGSPATLFEVSTDDEATWIDEPPLPPPSAACAMRIADITPTPTPTPMPAVAPLPFEHAVRAQLTAEPAPVRYRRAAGTDVPGLGTFDVSDTSAPPDVASPGFAPIDFAPIEPTGARPLIATRHEIVRAGSEPAVPELGPRLAIGSSPVIADVPVPAPPPVVVLPPAPASRLGPARMLVWAMCLIGIGMLVGMGVALIAG